MAEGSGFEVSLGRHLFSGAIWKSRGLQIKLGNMESTMADEAIEDIKVQKPIYVSGLARSGTTILLECIASHPQVGTHRYRDFPALFTPYWWNRYLDMTPREADVAEERAHKDGIMVTPESPEAMEEMLWMSFFPDTHDPSHSSVLSAQSDEGAFGPFYRDHIRKLLAVRGKTRYAAKGNYNLVRLGYLQKLFSDARFVVPVRNPIDHIASLMKQHKLFCAACEGNSRALAHLARVGHFEFGLDRKPINPGDDETTGRVLSLWAEGKEVEGWAHYWAMIHRFVAQQRDAGGYDGAMMVIRYEDLCDKSTQVASDLVSHCGLEDKDGFTTFWADKFHRPTYYKPKFNEQETALIWDIVGDVAAKFDYAPQ